MKNIWTNGCFDILHIGHVSLFRYAKSLGEKLYVGIDSDYRIKQLKGINRPINNQNYRKEMLEYIKYVDEVFIFNTDEELIFYIKNNQIDTMVIGSDYKNKTIIGQNYVKFIDFFDKIPNISSTNLINKIYD